MSENETAMMTLQEWLSQRGVNVEDFPEYWQAFMDSLGEARCKSLAPKDVWDSRYELHQMVTWIP